MSSSSTTDGETGPTSPPAQNPAQANGPAGSHESSQAVERPAAELFVAERSIEETAADAARRRESFIPMPDGFRQRRAPSLGLDFAGSVKAGLSSQPTAAARPQASNRPSAPAEEAASQPPAPPRPREPALAPPRPAREVRENALPRLVLAPLDAPELIYERLQEPSEQSPILYRERAYLVDGLQTDDDLEDQLETELSVIRRDWSQRNESQFVHLALFDHSFQDEPDSPPIATLSWKDWQGKPELWVRGVRRSIAPTRFGSESKAPPALLELDDAEVESADPNDSEPIPLVARARQTQPPLRTEPSRSNPASFEPESPILLDSPDQRPPDSGPGWQSPGKSGEYLIPLTDAEIVAPPPSSQRVLAGEEAIGALFERMHELSYLPDIATGAAYVLETVEEFIPCQAALVHVFDIDTREFVVVRALGPRSRDVITSRTSGGGSHLEDALRRQTTVQLSAGSHPLWQALGVEPEHVLCGPVHQNGRYLGAIELGRDAERGSFNDGHVSALEYICEQFADFLADRPLELTPRAILPPPVPS